MWYVYFIHFFVRVLLPLFFGGAIYIFFGDARIRLVKWALNFDFIDQLRQKMDTYHLPDWLVFNLPDGVWLFALLQLVDIIWAGDENNSNNWMVLSVLLAVVHEVGQYVGMFPGTFDVLDLMSYAIFTIIALLLNRFLRT